MADLGLPKRTLRTSFWLAAWFVLIFGVRGQAKISLGIALGAAVSMFSLWSLMIVVPRLADGAKKPLGCLLGIVELVKLPLYALVFWYAMASPFFHPLAVFAGVATVPVVIVLKVVGYQIVQRANGSAGDDSCRKGMTKSR